ncbi:MAG: Histidine N-alpha-methyltransferase [Chroococcopsis gigantea SAG 12.99]|jgi:L-histidine N-alpha-methyltransferase|nr:Histidine N-alpha-methyltransferase [Chroococcopsis gigantea SAG 12.99]
MFSHPESFDRLQIDYLKINCSDDGADVIQGLSQPRKSLPPHYFYDAAGSQLFERICELPEYYPTRTEASILRDYAEDIITVIGDSELVELGSGSSTKTRFLISAYKSSGYHLHYIPVDISPTILSQSAEELLREYPWLRIRGLVGTYDDALGQLTYPRDWTRVIAFLGSTLGNFSQAECDRFFAGLKPALKSGDYVLLGLDLQKPVQILESAYNDSQGVTAQFNLNMLAHLNHRFGGDFDPGLFRHRAIYNQKEHQIEMYLIAGKAHSVNLSGLDLRVNFEAGEKILTEISRKFALETMSEYLNGLGFKTVRTWTDDRQYFGLLLIQLA